ncbi:MAG: hypothetical protein ABIP93_06540 [Gemmatimonadaceae bacterium]
MRHTPRRPLILTCMLVAIASGCGTWHQRELPTSSTNTAVAGGRLVRVTLSNGMEVMLSSSRVIGDSLVGDAGSPPRRLALATSEIRSVEERGGSGKRSALLGVGIGIGVGALVAVVAAVATFAFIIGHL